MEMPTKKPGAIRRGTAVMAKGTGRGAEGISYAMAAMLPWLLVDLAGLDVPDNVMTVLSAMATGFAVRIRDYVDKKI